MQDLPIARLEQIEKLTREFEQHLIVGYTIAHLAAQLRAAQKAFFLKRRGEDLVEAKRLEKQLDSKLKDFFK